MPLLQFSSSFVELDQHNRALLTLTRNQEHPNSKVGSILFKVRTNIKDDVVVKNNYGMLLQSDPISTITLQIQCAKTLEDISKAKLQINWLHTNDNLDQYQNKPIKQIRELYNHYRQELKGESEEGSLLFPFARKPKLQEQPEFRFEDSARNQHLPSYPQPQPPEQICISQIRVEQELPLQKSTNAHSPTGTSLKQTTLYLFFTFLFGIVLGMKLQRLDP